MSDTPNQEDIKFEAVGFKVCSFLKGNPTQQYLAIQMDIQGEAGTIARQQWLALSPELAQRLSELLQTSLAARLPSRPDASSLN